MSQKDDLKREEEKVLIDMEGNRERAIINNPLYVLNLFLLILID